jgi:D-alanyl-D-alanine carboxypeptidase
MGLRNGEIIMHRVPLGAASRLRWGCLGLAAIVALVAVASDPADARSRRKHHHAKRTHHAAASYNPPYADIVVDAKTGKVLHQSNPDAARFPASLTKVMTLYLLFEQIEAGKITLDTPMEISEHASIQAPTKLGLRPGDTLKVEDAIKGLVTKSANDAAVVIAETLGGSEENFAAMMTRKARALGMRNTFYHNASGLPDDLQKTTARDQALLGMAIQNRFPKYYRYFSLPSFVYRGHALRNHNHLLGSVDGVDGIKTGYTRASGFNLITSVRRGGRHIVAVVLGGSSAGSRDARMRNLIATNIAEASTRPKSQPQVAEAPIPAPRPAFEAPAAAPQLAAAASIPMPLRAPAAPRETVKEAAATVPVGSNAPLKPVKVRTMTVTLVPPKNAAGSDTTEVAEGDAADQSDALQDQGSPADQNGAPETAAATEAAVPPALPTPRRSVLAKLQPVLTAAKNAAVTSAKAAEVSGDQAILERPTARRGWAIQIGAYEDKGEAKQRLNSAKGKVAGVLHKAEAYIERTVKGAKTYYRARFAGFDRNQAQAACKKLKHDDIACMALKI